MSGLVDLAALAELQRRAGSQGGLVGASAGPGLPSLPQGQSRFDQTVNMMSPGASQLPSPSQRQSPADLPVGQSTPSQIVQSQSPIPGDAPFRPLPPTGLPSIPLDTPYPTGNFAGSGYTSPGATDSPIRTDPGSLALQGQDAGIGKVPLPQPMQARMDALVNPGPAQQALANHTDPDPVHGFLAHLKGIGKGLLAGGPIGAIAGGIDPNLINRALDRTQTLPRLQRSAMLEAQQQDDQMRRVQEMAGLTGVNPIDKQQTEPAKLRETQIEFNRLKQQELDAYRWAEHGRKDDQGTRRLDQGQDRLDQSQDRADQKKIKDESAAAANDYYRGVKLTPAMRVAMTKGGHDGANLPEQYDPQLVQTKPNGDGTYTFFSVGKNTGKIKSGDTGVTTPPHAGGRMSPAQAQLAARDQLKAEGKIDADGNMDNPRYKELHDRLFGLMQANIAKGKNPNQTPDESIIAAGIGQNVPAKIPYAKHPDFHDRTLSLQGASGPAPGNRGTGGGNSSNPPSSIPADRGFIQTFADKNGWDYNKAYDWMARQGKYRMPPRQ